jgi:shikimate dehydrogenase
MHNAAFRAAGLEGWLYVRLPLPPERFDEAVRALPASGYRGINVTIPHKEAALRLADRAGDEARAIGAANTLTFGDDGIAADNTDAGGFLDALGESPAGRSALVLGAGGAARAVIWALREQGADVAVWNRSAGRAAALADELGVRHAGRPAPAEIVVNATSVGLHGSEADLPLDELGAPATVVDLPYSERATPTSVWGLRVGSRVVNGIDVLVAQGARSFRLWTGLEPSIHAMTDAARAPGNPITMRVPLP